MKKFVCQVCGYVHEGEAAPDFCPQCKVPASKFTEQGEEKVWAAEHVVGVAQGKELYNAFYGTKTRKEVVEAQEAAFWKEIRRLEG